MITVLMLMIGISLFAQDPFIGWSYATPTTPLGRRILAKQYILIASTGQVIQLLQTAESNTTPAAIIAKGSAYYKPFPSSIIGVSSITPATTGTGTVGTSALNYLYGYFRGIVNRDSITPATTGAGTVGTITHKFGAGYINNLTASSFSTSTCGVSGGVSWTTIGVNIQATAGNHNSISVSHSLGIVDTVTAPVGQITTINSTNTNTATIIANKVPWFTVAAGVCTHNVVSALDTWGCAALRLTTSGLALCQYAALTTTAIDTLRVVYQYKAGWITFQGKFKKDIKYWIPKY